MVNGKQFPLKFVGCDKPFAVTPLHLPDMMPILNPKKFQHLILLEEIDELYGLFYQPTDYDQKSRCTLFGFNVDGKIGLFPLSCVEIEIPITMKYKPRGRLMIRGNFFKWNMSGAVRSNIYSKKDILNDYFLQCEL
eukprot:TRINITY_DN10485_c0_g1_i1.p1 TRINITY_DN10485_c0_g1~~TRINITY_DN10485_c0_g1_i1.p1  ORF type:complete len:136 (-),score=14.44 TRINITY_DN10485_c0_g1_i1:3-410(-)